MIRNLKALGLALVAVFAMSAMAASAAQAVEAEFSWPSGTTQLDPVQDGSHLFTITPGTITSSFTCDQVTASAAVTNTGAKTVTATGIVYDDTGTLPETGKCTGNVNGIALKTTVNFNGCDYKFIAGDTQGNMAEGKSEGTATIECTGTNKIEVSAAGCVVKVGPQTVGPVYFETVNTTGTNEVTIKAEVDPGAAPHTDLIDYTTTGITCGIHSETDGTYTGNVKVKGTNGGVQTAVAVT